LVFGFLRDFYFGIDRFSKTFTQTLKNSSNLILKISKRLDGGKGRQSALVLMIMTHFVYCIVSNQEYQLDFAQM